MTTETGAGPREEAERQSLGTAAARNLTTTTKTSPQMQGISSRWLLRMLPWVEAEAGTYRVNRRLRHVTGSGRVGFVQTGGTVRVAPPTLTELAALRGVRDPELLDAVAGLFVQREAAAGEVLAERGRPVGQMLLIAHGRVTRRGRGKYGGGTVLGELADGDHVGEAALSGPSVWQYTATASTPCTLLSLDPAAFTALAERSEELRDSVRRLREAAGRPQDKHGQAEIRMSAGHSGEPTLPGTFVDYELKPREYELSVAQTVLRVHSRVADLFNNPMSQVEKQLELTVHALRERQEDELINNRDFGLLHNADYSQRIPTRHGPPTPDDMDELVSRRRSTKFILAHPRAMAAFGRECSRRGLYPESVPVHDKPVPAWRGIPILPCDKIPVDAGGTSSILAMRVGADNQGVVGLRQTGIPDEVEPGLNVRFMGIDDRAVMSYLVSTYYSAAALVPDALGVLENVDVAVFD